MPACRLLCNILCNVCEDYVVIVALPALRKIVELLIQLKTSVNTLAEQVRINTMTVQSMTSSTTAEIPDDLNMELPIANQQALDSVEEELKQNRSMYKSLVCVTSPDIYLHLCRPSFEFGAFHNLTDLWFGSCRFYCWRQRVVAALRM